MKTCSQCNTEFAITDADRAFYKKIQVPEPTCCPDCRQQRRLAWRNERFLYPRKCDACKKDMVSIYSPEKPYKIFCSKCWWGDSWDAREFGRPFDFRRPFFEQLKELQLSVPRITLYGKNNENSDYTNHTDHAKDSYMCVDVGFGEKLMYSQWMISCKDCVDCYQLMNAELCYECLYSDKLYHAVGCFFADNARDCHFIYHCEGASDCFFASNKPKAQYVWKNERLHKDEYQKRLQEVDLGSYAQFRKYADEYNILVKEAIHKHVECIHAEGCSGDFMYRCKNVRDSYDMVDAEECRFCYECIGIKDSYDAYESGFRCELQYETHACNRTSHAKFASVCYDDSFIEYCDLSHNSFNLFGCVGMKKNEYCILNKQYTKDEYEKVKLQITDHMKETGEYGMFFPPSLSPFGYNETVAQYHYPLTEDEAAQKGFNWYVGGAGVFGKTTLPSGAIPDHIKDTDASVTKEILECIECKKNYKVIKQEFEFYKKQNIPIPRLCPDCRYKRRLSLCNPRRLWHRQCMCTLKGHGHHADGVQCPNEFETTYAPERPEMVFCEVCYQKEVL